MSAKHRLKENSIIPLVFNQMLNCPGAVRDDGWVQGAPFKSDTFHGCEHPREEHGSPLCLLLCSTSAFASFLLTSGKVMGRYEAEIEAILFQRPKQTLLVGGEDYSTILPFSSSTGFWPEVLSPPLVLPCWVFPFLLTFASLPF